MSSSQRRGSQFAGAAALFQQKEKELLENNMKQVGNSSLGHISYSPKRDSGKASLKPPPFVSPGAGASSRSGFSHYATSSYLGKPSGTPTQKPKLKVESSTFSGLSFSPSPEVNGKPKLDAKSWKDKASISFQATSPGTLKKKHVRPTFNQHFGGSFLERSSPQRTSAFEETPDIKIEVKIPDIDKKIRARRESVRQAAHQAKEEHVPEWLMKQRQRAFTLVPVYPKNSQQSLTNVFSSFFFLFQARPTEFEKKMRNRNGPLR